jgi:hypothetical protein
MLQTVQAASQCKSIAKGSLTFCTDVDYDALLDSAVGSETTADTQANDWYDPNESSSMCSTSYLGMSFFLLLFLLFLWLSSMDRYDSVTTQLARFNCEDFFPFHSCTPCATAYKNWACAINFPKCRSSPSTSNLCKPCHNLCYEVVRKCPVELGFDCPDETDEYSTRSDDCNDMGTGAGAADLAVRMSAIPLFTALICAMLL